jgi:hypothetical protein
VQHFLEKKNRKVVSTGLGSDPKGEERREPKPETTDKYYKVGNS